MEWDKIVALGYGFQVEMVHSISRKGFSIAEVPVLFKDRTRGQSKMGIHIAWEGFFKVMKLRFFRGKGGPFHLPSFRSGKN